MGTFHGEKYGEDLRPRVKSPGDFDHSVRLGELLPRAEVSREKKDFYLWEGAPPASLNGQKKQM